MIEEEIVEGSEGRSVNSGSDMSEEEGGNASHPRHLQHGSGERSDENRLRSSIDALSSNDVDTNAVAAAANGGVVVTTTGLDGSSVNGDANTALRSNHRRRRHRHRGREETLNEDDLDDDDEDEEDMELDDEEDEINEDNEIVEDEGDEDEDENGDDDDDEDDDEDEEEENEEDDDEDEDAASEYYDAYNQMLDFINDDAGENGEEDDFLAHIENLWQNNGNSNHIVLGHQLG